MHILFHHTYKRGSLLLMVLVYMAIGVSAVTAFVGWGVTLNKVSQNLIYKEQALQIAEAGIEYYRWHLAHDSDDFQDGTGSEGPYVHDYKDKNEIKIGEFELSITPPAVGSTKVIVESKGSLVVAPTITRSIRVTLAKPSFAKYSVAANEDIRFGEGTVTYGPMHSNGGIRFDGVSNNVVTSALVSYNDPDHTGSNEYGVHTHIKPPPQTGSYTEAVSAESPPFSMATRSDVFVGGRNVGVPAIDFNSITADLATLKTTAQSAQGVYLAPSGKFGYHLVLKTNDTFDIYKVKKMYSQGSCTDQTNSGVSGQEDWGTWSIKSGNGETFVKNEPIPSSGVVFVEDDVWVDGTINTAKITIAAGTFPVNAVTWKSITLNNDLKYTNFDGQDVIGLIAQNNINIGLVSDTDLEIDAALIAQNGRVGRYYYDSSCSPYHNRNSISLFGMIGTNKRYGFAYTGSSSTGYDTRTITYDANLLYAPPPSFPLTSDFYTTLLWEQLD
ncbi:MAG: pilus assembly PilX N-terminal domain-containing protein [Candidatus Pacebacteria bacterium]|nr:pilus assembly PilX N-terminal domain-containing protein [Candidatus Paceibacterota bacterium]